MSPKIQAIIDQAPEKLRALLTEAADQLEEAIVAAAAEAQAQEAEAKLNVSFAIKMNLDRNAVEYAVSWSVRHTLSHSCPLPDPNQLTFEEGGAK